MGILRSNDGNTVDRVSMPRASQRRLLNGSATACARRPSIPKQYLPRVRTANNEIRVEWREFGGQDVRGRMKDILRSGVKVLVPDLDETIGFMRGRRVLGVCSQNKFGELWRCQVSMRS